MVKLAVYHSQHCVATISECTYTAVYHSQLTVYSEATISKWHIVFQGSCLPLSTYPIYIYIYVGCMCYLSEVDTAMIDDSLEMYFLATRSDVDEGGGWATGRCEYLLLGEKRDSEATRGGWKWPGRSTWPGDQETSFGVCSDSSWWLPSWWVV